MQMTLMSLILLQKYLGDDLAAALPAFHALSGADITGSFSKKGKLTCWGALMECPKSVVDAFQFLGTTLHVPENILTEVEKYVCKLYDVKTHVDTLEELRWLFFIRKASTFGRTTTDQSYIVSSCTSGSFPVDSLEQ